MLLSFMIMENLGLFSTLFTQSSLGNAEEHAEELIYLESLYVALSDKIFLLCPCPV